MEKWLAKAVMAMYEGARTVVRTTGDTNAFRLHQGSVLSPLLFVIVMKAGVQLTAQDINPIAYTPEFT